MVYPTVESISSLASYAKNIHMFSDSYLKAANASYRTYSVALTGQHGDAVQAFVDKLNTLQAQVFDQYPKALATYAQTVATYEEALTGHGFNERMWSDKSGSEKLKELYTGDQATEISDKVTEMNNLLKSAAEAAGVEAPDLSSIKTTATDGFKKAGDARGDLASDIDSKWKTFTETLTSNAETIKAFQPAINNATYLSQLSLTDIANRITSGQLSAEHMYYLDGLQNKHDIDFVKLMMKESTYDNKTDFFTDLGRFKNALLISDGAIDTLHGRLFEEMDQLDENGYSKNLGYFFQSMTVNHSKEFTTEYAKRLSLASARFAGTLKPQAVNKMDEEASFPKDGSPAEMYEKYFHNLKNLSPFLTHLNEQLENASLLNNIFEYIYVNELGAQSAEDDKLPHIVKAINKDTVRFNNAGDIKDVQFTVLEGLVPNFDLLQNSKYSKEGKYKEGYIDPFNFIDNEDVGSFRYSTNSKVTITDQQSSTGVDIGKGKERLEELRDEQKKATKDLIANIAVSASGEIPYVGSVIKVAKNALYDKDIVDTFYSKVSGELPKGVDSTKKIIQNIFEYGDKSDVVNAEIKTEKDGIRARLWDIGGPVPQNGGKMKTHFNSVYDLEGVLRQHDMEQNGLRSYAYRNQRMNNGSNEDAIRKVEDLQKYLTKSNSITKETKELFKGNSGKMISDEKDGGISSQAIQNALENLSRQKGFSYDDWGNTDSKFFGNLVGSKSTFE